jgi:hypothetical protein
MCLVVFDSPMNFVLARAERQLGASCAVYWVDDSAPEMFSLRGFSLPVAVFSSRYVELWADIRATLATRLFGTSSRSSPNGSHSG